MKNYEKIRHSDPNFPVTFHNAELTRGTTGFYMHWHEHIELLYITSGSITVTINDAQVDAASGDLVVINSNAMHAIFKKDKNCCYHCLILDKLFCDGYGISIDKLNFSDKVTDDEISALFAKISLQMSAHESYYKALVQAYSVELLAILARKYSVSADALAENHSGISLARKAISYISANYKEDITVDDIAEHIGFSKYYLCHSFKEVTGQTVFDYINLLRCTQARKLICSGGYNINESALKSGFNNLSYFTKTYKKYFGVLPSSELGSGKPTASGI